CLVRRSARPRDSATDPCFALFRPAFLFPGIDQSRGQLVDQIALPDQITARITHRLERLRKLNPSGVLISTSVRLLLRLLSSLAELLHVTFQLRDRLCELIRNISMRAALRLSGKKRRQRLSKCRYGGEILRQRLRRVA